MMSRLKANSIQEKEISRTLALENLYLMRRLVNAAKSVNFTKLD